METICCLALQQLYCRASFRLHQQSSISGAPARFGNKSDVKIYIDLCDSLRYTDEIEKLSRNYSKLNVRIELRNPLAKKMRLRVLGYTNGEYFYMLTDGSLTLKYKTYTIKWLDNALEA